MKRLGSAADDHRELVKRERHKRYEWCRLRNEFLDDPLWRVVAQLAGVPLYQVQAFVVRLESLANKADPRGYVGDFRAVEFAAAQAMTPDEAARIFAALEHPDVGWVDHDHVATFFARNPDKEDETAPQRDRRRKARRWIRAELGRRVRAGAIDELQLDELEALFGLISDEELFAIKKHLAGGGAWETSLSTGHAGHAVALRGFRGSHAQNTPEQSRKTTAAVNNSGAANRGPEAGPPKEPGRVLAPSPPPEPADDAEVQEAELWLSTEAVRIVTERMDVHRNRAEMLLQRWRRDLDGDPVPIAAIVRALDEQALAGPRFHVAVTDHVARCVRARQHGAPLPLPPVQIAGQRSAAARPVVPSPVDIASDADEPPKAAHG